MEPLSNSYGCVNRYNKSNVWRLIDEGELPCFFLAKASRPQRTPNNDRQFSVLLSGLVTLIDKQLESLPMDVLKRYEKWKDVIYLSGPEGVKQIKGFRDEALRGEWKGYRSSRLNIQYRVIYKIEKNLILVQVVKVTAHDYRKK